MKKLERPNGYFQTWDPSSGRKIEGETRQCVHCAYMWIYNPMESFSRKLAGKSITRGKCLKCFGLVCARPECMKQGCKPQAKQIEELENAHRKGHILLA